MGLVADLVELVMLLGLFVLHDLLVKPGSVLVNGGWKLRGMLVTFVDDGFRESLLSLVHVGKTHGCVALLMKVSFSSLFIPSFVRCIGRNRSLPTSSLP